MRVDLVEDARVGHDLAALLGEMAGEEHEAFEQQINTREEVLECYLMTGDSDYLLRVVMPDLAAYERFLMDHLTRVPGVASIKSSFALRAVKYRTDLPV